MRSKTNSNDTSTRIVFFGNEELTTGVQLKQSIVMTGLIEAGYEITALILNKSTREKRRFAVEDCANENNIPTHMPANKQELTEIATGLSAEIGILVAFGTIVPQAVIDHFPFGILNLHPSLLPSYRGSTPIEQTILDGTKQTGISIMQLEAGLDSGPIFAQTVLNLQGDESKADLATKLTVMGSELILKVLPTVISGKITPTVQDENGATYTNQITKQNGRLEPTLHSATELKRQIRAYAGWPTSYLELNGTTLTILQADVSSEQVPAGKLTLRGKRLLLGCKTGSLDVQLIRPAGKSPMMGLALANGYKRVLS